MITPSYTHWLTLACHWDYFSAEICASLSLQVDCIQFRRLRVHSTEKIRSRRRRIQFILSLTIETNIEYYSMMTIDTMIRYSMIRMQWRDGGAQSSFSSCVHGQTVENRVEWGHTMHFIRFPVRNFRSSVVYVYVNIVIYARIRLLNLQTTNASHNSYKV